MKDDTVWGPKFREFELKYYALYTQMVAEYNQQQYLLQV